MTKQVGLSRSRITNFLMEYLVLLAIVALVVVTAIMEPRFLSGANITNLMRQFGPLSFVALGMTFIILGGFIDLSVPGMISLIAMITLGLVDTIGEIPAMMVGIALGTTLGAINGTVLVVSGANTQAKAFALKNTRIVTLLIR